MTSFLYRSAAVLASLIFLAAPSLAQTSRASKSLDGLDLRRPRVIVNVACTDTFDVPATTSNVNLTTLANWDTMAEAVNPDKNIGNAVQTSGSADGWCDSTPWIVAGSFTSGATSDVFFGPLIIGDPGFVLQWNFASIVTNYQFFVGYKPLLSPTTFLSLMGQTAIATLGILRAEVGPVDPVGSQMSAFDNEFFISGVPHYLRLRTTGAGAYTYSLETYPLRPYYEEK